MSTSVANAFSAEPSKNVEITFCRAQRLAFCGETVGVYT